MKKILVTNKFDLNDNFVQYLIKYHQPSYFLRLDGAYSQLYEVSLFEQGFNFTQTWAASVENELWNFKIGDFKILLSSKPVVRNVKSHAVFHTMAKEHNAAMVVSLTGENVLKFFNDVLIFSPEIFVDKTQGQVFSLLLECEDDEILEAKLSRYYVSNHGAYEKAGVVQTLYPSSIVNQSVKKVVIDQNVFLKEQANNLNFRYNNKDRRDLTHLYNDHLISRKLLKDELNIDVDGIIDDDVFVEHDNFHDKTSFNTDQELTENIKVDDQIDEIASHLPEEEILPSIKFDESLDSISQVSNYSSDKNEDVYNDNINFGHSSTHQKDQFGDGYDDLARDPIDPNKEPNFSYLYEPEEKEDLKQEANDKIAQNLEDKDLSFRDVHGIKVEQIKAFVPSYKNNNQNNVNNEINTIEIDEDEQKTLYLEDFNKEVVLEDDLSKTENLDYEIKEGNENSISEVGLELKDESEIEDLIDDKDEIIGEVEDDENSRFEKMMKEKASMEDDSKPHSNVSAFYRSWLSFLMKWKMILHKNKNTGSNSIDSTELNSFKKSISHEDSVPEDDDTSGEGFSSYANGLDNQEENYQSDLENQTHDLSNDELNEKIPATPLTSDDEKFLKDQNVYNLDNASVSSSEHVVIPDITEGIPNETQVEEMINDVSDLETEERLNLLQILEGKVYDCEKVLNLYHKVTKTEYDLTTSFINTKTHIIENLLQLPIEEQKFDGTYKITNNEIDIINFNLNNINNRIKNEILNLMNIAKRINLQTLILHKEEKLKNVLKDQSFNMQNYNKVNQSMLDNFADQIEEYKKEHIDDFGIDDAN